MLKKPKFDLTKLMEMYTEKAEDKKAIQKAKEEEDSKNTLAQ
jgi:hypothetical protein